MHIPDGFLSAPIAAGYGALSLLGIGAACHRLRATRKSDQRARLGVSAAFIFAAQMVSFPVAAGTSGHLVGAVLAVALLGLPSALVVMASVLLVQCFVFGDGGVLALGANVFNMALVSCVVGAGLLRLLCGRAPSPTRRIASVAFAAWCATVAAAASCAEQLALSDAASWSLVVPTALGIHALVGVGEAVITALIVAAVLRARPELLERGAEHSERRASPVAAGLGLALAMVVLLAPLAYAAPDGLSRLVRQLGFQSAEQRSLGAPLDDYRVPGLGSGALTTIAAGCLGTVILFGLCWLLALALSPRSRRAAEVRRLGRRRTRRFVGMSGSSAVALKLGLCLALILGVGALPAHRAGWALLALPLLAMIAVALEVELRPLLRRTRRTLPFLLGLAGLSLFQPHGALRSLSLFSKSLVSVCTLQLLIATTPGPELVRALRRARVPEVLVSTVALLSRYSSLIAGEYERMNRARAGRTLRESRWALWHARATSIGLLFVRSVQRAERVQAAMRARGGT